MNYQGLDEEFNINYGLKAKKGWSFSQNIDFNRQLYFFDRYSTFTPSLLKIVLKASNF